MTMMKSWAFVAALLLSAPATAGITVSHDGAADFSRHKTYAWGKGTPAARPEIEQWIRSAVDRELQAKGLSPAPEARADLIVVTVAFAQMGMATRSVYFHLDQYDVGVLRSDVIDMTDGHLLVDLVDPATQKPIWRGAIEEAMDNQDPDKIRKKIDKLTHKLFTSFPPERIKEGAE